MTGEPTVFVVDDDPSVLDAVALLLQTVGWRVETYDSAQAFLDAYDPRRRGCLILDIRLKGQSGLELQEELNRRDIGLPVIIITAHGGHAPGRAGDEGRGPRLPPQALQ